MSEKYDSEQEVVSTPVVAGGMVLLTTKGYGIVALDANTGAIRWRASVATGEGENDAIRPLLSGGLVLMASGVSDTLSAFEAATGKERWKLPLLSSAGGLKNEYWLRPVVVKGVGFVYDGASTVYGLRISDRKVLWRTTAECLSSERPVVAGGRVHLATHAGLLSLDPRDGTEVRRIPMVYSSDLRTDGRMLFFRSGYTADATVSIHAVRP